MDFPLDIMILTAIVLSIILAFLVYGMLNPEALYNPSLIITHFISFVKHRQSLISNYLIEKKKRLRRIQAEKVRLEFIKIVEQQKNQSAMRSESVPDKDIPEDTEIRSCKQTNKKSVASKHLITQFTVAKNRKVLITFIKCLFILFCVISASLSYINWYSNSEKLDIIVAFQKEADKELQKTIDSQAKLEKARDEAEKQIIEIKNMQEKEQKQRTDEAEKSLNSLSILERDAEKTRDELEQNKSQMDHSQKLLEKLATDLTARLVGIEAANAVAVKQNIEHLQTIKQNNALSGLKTLLTGSIDDKMRLINEQNALEAAVNGGARNLTNQQLSDAIEGLQARLPNLNEADKQNLKTKFGQQVIPVITARLGGNDPVATAQAQAYINKIFENF